MTQSKEQLVQQVVNLLNADTTNADHFFSKEDNSKWLESLEPYGFFKADKIKPVVRDGNSFYYPSWPQGVFLEKIAEQIRNGRVSDKATIELYLKVIRSLVGDNENVWAMRSIFRCHFLLPLKVIEVNDISNSFKMIEKVAKTNSFIEFDVHESYFKVLGSVENNTHDRSLYKEFVRNLLMSRDEEDIGLRERKLIYFQDHRFKHFEGKFLNFEEQYAGKEFALEDAAEVISQRLDNLLDIKDVDKTSTSWRPAIEDHYQNLYHYSAPSILIAIIYKIINFLIKRSKLLSIVGPWKTSDKSALSRLYIALVTENPSLLDINECARRILSLGLSYHFRHEVFHFFEKHFDNLDSDIQESILDKVDSLVDKYSDDNDERKPVFTAWKKMRWLQAIKNSKNKRAKELYEANLKITGSEADHPDFDSYIGRTFVGPTSPWGLDNFDQATPDEIIQKLISYVDDERKFGEPSIEGLSRTFESYVAQDPMKCSFLIDKMLQLPRIYLSSIFDGYVKAWADGKFVPIKELLDLGNSALTNKLFINDLSDKNSMARWAVSSIFRFISAGVRDDEKAFDPKFNLKCHEILKLAVVSVKANEEYQGSSDAQTRAINEPRGVLFESAILLALREARLAYDESDEKSKDSVEFKQAWLNLYQIIKEPLESQSCDEVSLHAHLGSLYRQLLFLDKMWLYKNLDLVCPSGEGKFQLRSAFIQGYCYVNVYVKEMYTQLYTRGYLLEFLRQSDEDDKNNGSRINTLQERIVSLSTIAFLLGDESLERGLFKDILDYEDAEEWGKIIRSLPRLVGKDPVKDVFDNAVLLIHYMINKFDSSKEKELFKKHFDGFSWLLEIFKDPSNVIVKKIIEISAYYTSDHWDHFEIVEYLYNYKDSHTEEVGSLFYELAKSGKGYPSYPDDKIIAICKSLKNSGKTESLTNIRRVYSDKSPNSDLTKKICEI